MKAILQRVLSASVTVEKELVSSIGQGVLVFAAVAPDDTEKEADSLAAKVLKMKMWEDGTGKWKRSVKDIGGEVLCVSQFTLLAKTSKGSKPDFHGSAGPEHASCLYHYFVRRLQEQHSPERVKDGRFQAMMQVALVNDGPVTLELCVDPKPAGERPAGAKPKQKKAAPGKQAPSGPEQEDGEQKTLSDGLEKPGGLEKD